jgi:hypothetical protein
MKEATGGPQTRAARFLAHLQPGDDKMCALE